MAASKGHQPGASIHRFGVLRRFRFHLPQRIAAGLLALFLLEESWFAAHRTAQVSAWPSLAFLGAGCLLGGSLWWVARRLYGNLGGYAALAFYCFSLPVLGAAARCNLELLAGLGIYGGVYTAIGVAHALQGPAARWRPRILLLMAGFAVAAAAQMAALPVALAAGLLAMLWVAEGRRQRALLVFLLAVAGALGAIFAACGFSPGAFAAFLRPAITLPRISLDPAWRLFSAPANAGLTLALPAALGFYLAMRRSRYFGNTVPLLAAAGLLLLAPRPAAGLLALPFLLTFLGGVFADVCESRHGRLAFGATALLVLLQAVLCGMSLPGMFP
ncbi:MAG: hypothetical protein ACP5FH_05015 [Terracidiphilus sp.]